MEGDGVVGMVVRVNIGVRVIELISFSTLENYKSTSSYHMSPPFPSLYLSPLLGLILCKHK